ncbi:hypothetical protein QLX67_02845 [Balneolaceae bacterium ANBcel3]|nr:hypothetical protein [Balneolaceae bacterium ANBcel3]
MKQRNSPMSRFTAAISILTGLLIVMSLSFKSAASGQRGHDEGYSSEIPDTLAIDRIVVLEGLEQAHSLAAAGRDLMISIPDAGHIIRLFDHPDNDSLSMEILDMSDFLKPSALVARDEDEIFVICKISGAAFFSRYPYEEVADVRIPTWATEGRTVHGTDLSVNEIGELFILDERKRYLHHLNYNRDYLQTIPLNQEIGAETLTSAGETLIIADRSKGYLHIVTERGHPLARIGTFPEMHRVRYLDNKLYVLSGSVIHIFNDEGSHLANFSMDSKEPLLDIATDGSRLFLLTPVSLYYWDHSF